MEVMLISAQLADTRLALGCTELGNCYIEFNMWTSNHIESNPISIKSFQKSSTLYKLTNLKLSLIELSSTQHTYIIKADPKSNIAGLSLGYFMLFYQVWIARRATRSNLAIPQNFPLKKHAVQIVV